MVAVDEFTEYNSRVCVYVHVHVHVYIVHAHICMWVGECVCVCVSEIVSEYACVMFWLLLWVLSGLQFV